MTPAIKLPQ